MADEGAVQVATVEGWTVTFPKPDGIIEFGSSGCCCAPGIRRAGQHTNNVTSWWKIVWLESQERMKWQKCVSLSRAMRQASEAETCRAFAEAMGLETNEKRV